MDKSDNVMFGIPGVKVYVQSKKGLWNEKVCASGGLESVAVGRGLLRMKLRRKAKVEVVLGDGDISRSAIMNEIFPGSFNQLGWIHAVRCCHGYGTNISKRVVQKRHQLTGSLNPLPVTDEVRGIAMQRRNNLAAAMAEQFEEEKEEKEEKKTVAVTATTAMLTTRKIGKC